MKKIISVGAVCVAFFAASGLPVWGTTQLAQFTPIQPGTPGAPKPGQLPVPGGGQPLRPVAPDLVVVSVAPGPGARKPVSVTVRNAGDGAAAGFGLKVGYIARPAPGSSSNCQHGTVTGSAGPLAPGGQTTVSIDTGALGKAGAVLRAALISVCLDSDNRVAESNEANNCAQGGGW